MKAAKPLVNKKYLLEKFPGKSGWTYAAIPEILPDKHAHFGWVKVRGSIDGVAIKNYHLMPMGNGKLFLPVKAEIRKQIKKQAGDQVLVILFADESALEIPAELDLCLQDEPAAHSIFMGYTQSEQKVFIDWIYSAKKLETRAERIVLTIGKLLKREKLASKKE